LRPDAEARYAGPTGTQHLFVEVDRGTKRSHALAGQLAQYATYHASSGRDRVIVLLVTTGNERGWELLRLNETLSERVGMPPLDLLVTTQAEIAERGVQAHIWHSTSDPCDLLHTYISTTQVSAQQNHKE
jgi:hypothetical protein